MSGLWLLRLKATVLIKFSILPTAKWAPMAPWATPEQRSRLAWETRVVALIWLALVIVALLGIPGAGWLVFALVLSHVFQAVWLTTEHTGLPYEGTILARTRTMLPSGVGSLVAMEYELSRRTPRLASRALVSVAGRSSAHCRAS